MTFTNNFPTKTRDGDTLKRRRAVVLEQEFPGYDVVLQRAEASLLDDDDDDDHTALLCPHLRDALPHTLSLELELQQQQQQQSSSSSPTTSSSHQQQWILQKPVHALHLASQLDHNHECFTTAVRDMPMLYGEEQERRTVLHMQGFTTVPHLHSTDATNTTNNDNDWRNNHEWQQQQHHIGQNDMMNNGMIYPIMGPPLPMQLVNRNTVDPTNSTVVHETGVPLSLDEDTTVNSIAHEPLIRKNVHEKDEPCPSTHSLTAPAVVTNQDETMESMRIIPESNASSVHPEITESLHPEIIIDSTTNTPETSAESAKLDHAASQQSSSPGTSSVLFPVDHDIPAETHVPPVGPGSKSTQRRLLDENRYWTLHTQESHIETVRSTFLSKRTSDSAAAATASKKKRKSDSKPMALQYMMAWQDHRPLLHKPIHNSSSYRAQQERAQRQAQTWMEHYRRSRVLWQQEQQHETATPVLFGAIKEDTPTFSGRQCHKCHTNDNLMQCLECSFIACNSTDHMVRHSLESNHNFAVTCDRDARVYCFACGDYVAHEIFKTEKERIDLTKHLPWLSWKEHSVQRSFDAYRFIHIPDQGIFWKGMYATYPSIVPDSHVRGARACRRRQIIFHGDIEELDDNVPESTRTFVQEQHALGPHQRYRIPAPVGMYNLGNTCYQSSILQCLVACPLVAKYFLEDLQHPFATCQEHRSTSSSFVCLACAMDRFLLQYFGSARGVKALAVSENKESGDDDIEPQIQGDPLVGSELLLTTWKCPDLTHLAGYEQRDAHEFLHGFLDSLSKSDNAFHDKIRQVLGQAETASNGRARRERGLVKRLFDGSFRSVLICQECHNKRVQTESFMSISLPLSKDTSQHEQLSNQPLERSVESCLQSFTTPEALTDPVDCPCCRKKTMTHQQHVIRRLPRLLILHLKRFDKHHRKIELVVNFPEHGLNMGLYIPHWCETTRQVATNDNDEAAMPTVISYDLIGTVNHYGSLTSGHYTSNVKVQDRWYQINDQHVSVCDANQVVDNEAAYLLYYMVRSS